MKVRPYAHPEGVDGEAGRSGYAAKCMERGIEYNHSPHVILYVCDHNDNMAIQRVKDAREKIKIKLFFPMQVHSVHYSL